MPLQNRVQPDGQIIAHPGRGTFMGNRGILHDADGKLGRVRWRHKAWVTCLLSFKNRSRILVSPNAYTELFFLDEAVAFAAGHRPCGECRRDDFNRFRAAAGVTGRIAEYDAELHRARAEPRTFKQRRYRAEISSLPQGAFIVTDAGQVCRLTHDALLPYAPMAYEAPQSRPQTGSVTVLTPRLLVIALQNGYKLRCDQSL